MQAPPLTHYSMIYNVNMRWKVSDIPSGRTGRTKALRPEWLSASGVEGQLISWLLSSSLSLFMKHDFFTPYSNTYAVIGTKDLFSCYFVLYEGWWDRRHCVGEFKRDFSWQRSQEQYYTLRPCGLMRALQNTSLFESCGCAIVIHIIRRLILISTEIRSKELQTVRWAEGPNEILMIF